MFPDLHLDCILPVCVVSCVGCETVSVEVTELLLI